MKKKNGTVRTPVSQNLCLCRFPKIFDHFHWLVFKTLRHTASTVHMHIASCIHVAFISEDTHNRRLRTHVGYARPSCAYIACIALASDHCAVGVSLSCLEATLQSYHLFLSLLCHHAYHLLPFSHRSSPAASGALRYRAIVAAKVTGLPQP